MATKEKVPARELTNIGITEARAQLGELVDKVRYLGGTIILQKMGKPVAAIVSIEDAAIMQQRRDKAFANIRNFQEAAQDALDDLTEDEVDALVWEAIRETRLQASKDS